MAAAPKKRVVKDYDALPEDILRLVKMKYPGGYEMSLLSYTDAKGNKVSALPFETDDTYYLIRMTIQDARRLVKEDEDFDDEGVLREDFNEPTAAADEADGHEDDIEEFGGDDESGEDDHIIVTRRRDDDEEEASDGVDDY